MRDTTFEDFVPPDQAPVVRGQEFAHAFDEIALQAFLVGNAQFTNAFLDMRRKPSIGP